MKEDIKKIAGDVIVGFAHTPSMHWAGGAVVLAAADDAQLDTPSQKIASHLANNGHRTEIVDRYAPDAGIDIKRLAISASLGAFGKSGLVVTPQFGPRARFSVVLSDAPIEPDETREFNFCNGCKKCIEICPRGAISKQFDASACEERNENKRCLLCAEVCPVGSEK